MDTFHLVSRWLKSIFSDIVTHKSTCALIGGGIHRAYCIHKTHLIFDLCTGGELWAFLTAGSPHHRHPRPLDEATAQRFAREMLSAVSYMHARGVCHRDLKPQNWLLASAEPGAPLKLVDFGLSRRVPEGLSRSLDDSSSCSSREALEEQLEAVVGGGAAPPAPAARAPPPRGGG